MTGRPRPQELPRPARAPNGVARSGLGEAVDPEEPEAVQADPWLVATKRAGLRGDWVVPVETASPRALDDWLSWLVRAGNRGPNGAAWILVAETGRDGRRYIADLLGHGFEGEARHCATMLLTPDEAALLMENGIGEVGRTGLLLVAAADAEDAQADIRRGDRTALPASAAAVVLREPRRAAAWVATRAEVTPLLDGALETLPRAAAGQTPPSAAGRRDRRRTTLLGLMLIVGAGLSAAAVPNKTPSPAGVAAYAGGNDRRATPSGRVQTIPRPSTALLAYDAARRQLLLVGCCDVLASGDAAITWTWDGITWTAHHDALPPPIVRGSGSVSADPSARTVVLFGTNTENDTWTWDGAAWTLLAESQHAPDEPALLAYDSVSQTVVAADGHQTWTFDAAGWHPRSGAPPGFTPATWWATTEPATGRVVTAVDAEDGSGRLALRRWTGTSWLTVPTPAGPSLDAGFQIAGDPASGAVVYLGPPVNSFYPDLVPQTWVWDGHAWSRPSVDVTPTHGGRLISAFEHALFVEDTTGERPPTMWIWTGHGWSVLGADHRFSPSGHVRRGPGPGRS